MRDIKFNIWHPEDKKLHGPFSLQDIANKNIPFTLYQNDGITFGAPLKDALVWLQYSGVKDKNGKEIYEGDILEYEYKPDKLFVVRPQITESCGCCGTVVGWDFPGSGEGCKVVGNVFENPEFPVEQL